MPLKLDLDYIAVVNFAMQQNHAPVIREIRLYNDSDEPVTDIGVHIRFEPAFAQVFETHMERINPGFQEALHDIPLSFSTAFLSNLTERVTGSMTVTVTVGGGIVEEQSYEMTALTFNEWPGTDILPEMLAAFSTPNHPEVTRLIKQASVQLEEWTGSPSLDEYQTRDPNRVKLQMAALYNAIAAERITYAAVPPSFETTGQRIRLVDEVLSGKLGNCLDMTMLYASCLEAMGLHPLVVMTPGHAFAGAWLVMDSFADSVNDDPSLLTKRLAEGINEILVVETTCMNAGSQASFDEACLSANRKLETDKFNLFIDVYRARIGQIRPLPMRVATPGGWTLVDDTETERKYEAPDNLSATDIVIDQRDDVSKKTIWERKLLDLSLRNNLLNTRLTRETIPIISVNIHELEDALSANHDFQVLAKPSDWDNPLLSSGLYQSVKATDPVYELVQMELSQYRIRTYLEEDRLKQALTRLYRSSRTAMEENGANTLYLAFGLLKWFETPSSTKPRYAPILLVPVEIIRKSAASGYVIRSRDEDPMLNITMLEMLRQAFGIKIGGLDPLPTDENGIDVQLVFNTIRRKIMHQKGWDVVEQALLGNFSFSKFIMWNDIHNNITTLRENKIVSSLMDGVVDPSVNQEIGQEEDIDGRLSAGDIELPLSADSSQLEAIEAALSGKSFILHGPPGTGKSQTITNIIANALYRGKRVLFVAEKMAALEVVQKRLDAIGIGAFCLELHSNKAKKSSVLNQLKETTDVVKRKSSEQYSICAERINAIRKDLSGHIQSLHKKYPMGVSLYDCMARYASYSEQCPSLDFTTQEIGKVTAESLSHAEEALSEYRTACLIVGAPSASPLLGIRAAAYDPTTVAAFDGLTTLRERAMALHEEGEHIAQRLFGQGFDGLSEHQYRILAECVGAIAASTERAACLMSVGDDNTLKRVEKICAHGVERDTLRAKIVSLFDERILSLDVTSYEKEWRSALSRNFLSKTIATNRVRKILKTYAHSGKKPSASDVLPLLKDIASFQQEEKSLKSLQVRSVESVIDKCGEDWPFLSESIGRIRTVNQAIRAFTDDPELAISFRKRIATIMESGLQSDLAVFLDEVEESMKSIADGLSARFGSLSQDWAQSLALQCEIWARGKNQLRSWVMYNQKRASLDHAGFETVAEQVENGAIPEALLENAFHKGLYRAYAEYILSQESDLTLFHGGMFEDKIARFRSMCETFEQLTREEVYAKLASRLPALQKEASQNSEVGILQRNIRNGCRGVSLRKFFDMIPDLLPRMCPCMLMSPISVAQYIDTNAPKFDLVIFDEASQMPTCEAVGAIARGTSIIVVGDPKQMPPTSFFMASGFDEDNPNMEDLESILDDSLALSFPSKYLKWHYRSKHESLIAFSNKMYYDNKLLTFPSPDDIETKLGYQAVEGTYDRGHSRQNLAEAQAVIEEIRQRLSNPEQAARSIGVVTFNTNQQSLIEDLLTDLFARNPELERISMSSEEPIFVKNLENVQGDERDVILFSVGYGQDKDGKIALNFGPLNREGGWRRLNVAVSRARYEMKVFSTLRSEQIDLRRTNAEGVAGLKAFLEYAEKGRSVLRYNSTASAMQTDGFVEAVAVGIRQLGFEVNTNVGCSGFRVDIGVVDPENREKYILGIICDGYNSAAAHSVRDREIVQLGILHRLGWRIARVWTMDWWMNKDAVLFGIRRVIGKIMAGSFTETLTAVTVPSLDVPSQRAEEKAFNPIIPYNVCQLKPLNINTEMFLKGYQKAAVMESIRQVVRMEAPISASLLYKRVLRACGIPRTTPRIAGYLDSLIHDLKTTSDTFLTVWGDDQDPDSYPFIRCSNERDAADIPICEVFNAAKLVLEEQGALPEENLIREMARLFGYSRVGDNVYKAMSDGIQYAVKAQAVERINDRIRKI